MLYRDSKGQEHVVATMNPAKLINAYKAMVRDGWNVEKFDSQEDHDRCLAEMESQIAINRAAYIADLEGELASADPERAKVIREKLAALEAES